MSSREPPDPNCSRSATGGKVPDRPEGSTSTGRFTAAPSDRVVPPSADKAAEQSAVATPDPISRLELELFAISESAGIEGVPELAARQRKQKSPEQYQAWLDGQLRAARKHSVASPRENWRYREELGREKRRREVGRAGIWLERILTISMALAVGTSFASMASAGCNDEPANSLAWITIPLVGVGIVAYLARLLFPRPRGFHLRFYGLLAVTVLFCALAVFATIAAGQVGCPSS
jgi:hypothetical protein